MFNSLPAYNPDKYNNIRDAKVNLEHRMFNKEKKRKHSRGQLWESIIMQPIICKIENIK